VNYPVSKYFRFFKDGKYVLLINLVDKAFSFILFLLIARKFTPEAYGELVTIFTVTTVIVTIFDFGLPLFLQRETAAFKHRAAELFGKVFTISLILFAVYFIILFGFTRIIYSEIPIVLVVIVSVMIYTSALNNICSKSLAGLSDFKSQFTAIWISRLYTLLFFAAGFFFLSFSLNMLMLTVLTGFIFNLGLLFRFLFKNKISLSFGHFSLPEAKGILKLSIPLGLAVLFNFMYDKIDVILISKFRDYSDVAYYNVGYGLFKSAMLSYSFLLATGFTRVSALGRNRKAVGLFFSKYLRIILVISVPSAIVLYLISGPLIKLLYTAKFIPSINVLQILSAALVGNALNNLTGIILNGIGLFKAVMYITLFGLIVNVALNFVFIPLYGITGASIVTVVTEFVIFFFELYYVLRILNLPRA
jgi:O-antigen/teichoic acid export membrane protein